MSTKDTPQALLSEQLVNAEAGVLGSMLIDSDAVAPMLMAVEERDFQTPQHRTLFRAFREVFGRGGPVDPILVNEHLGGGYDELIQGLMEVTPTSANADAYAAALKKSSRLWQLRQIGDLLGQAEDEDKCRELIDKANLLFTERSGIVRMTMADAFKDFIRRMAQKPDFLRWGFGDLDEHIHVAAGDMVVIGGYPSAGKTAFALQLAFTVARKKRVGFFSYETGAAKLFDRNVACQTGTSFSKIMTRNIGEREAANIHEHRGYLTGANLDLIESSALSVSGIGAYAMAHHYDVIFIDYLQKIPSGKSARFSGDFERVSMVSHELQQLGRTTGKIVVALSQLSRPEKTKSGEVKPPRLSDLRQSGQIEQDADVVLLLYKEFPDWSHSPRLLDIAKNKDGMAGLGLKLNFDGDKQRFTKVASAAASTPEPKKQEQAQQSMFHPLPAYGTTPFDDREAKV